MKIKRLLSLALALMMVLGMLPVFVIEAEAAEDWRAWKQGDSRWGSIKLGDSSTMSGAGCLVTSVAKIMVQSGYVSIDSFDVGTLIKWLNANNTSSSPSFTSSGGLYWAKPTQMVSGLKFVDHEYGIKHGITGKSATCEAQLLNLVEEKYHIILKVNNGGHYIAVDNAKSLASGRIYIMDSLSSGKNADILLVDRYSTISDVALYSGWSQSGLDRLGYLVKCDPYPSHCQIQITSNTTTVKSLPCSKKTDPTSADIDTAYKGDYYTAIGLYKNTAGNLWYKVEAGNGETGYIYAGDTNYISQRTSDLSLTGVSAPTTIQQGDSFSIKGVIATKYQKLYNVGACVNSITDGSRYTGTILDVDTTSYNLHKSAVDSAVKFGILDPGEYSYTIVAAVRSYYAKSATEYQTVSAGVVLHESTFTVTKDVSCSHSYSATVTSPTCTDRGYTTYVCRSCGHSYVDKYTDALGHSYGGWVTSSSATCTADGVQTSMCSRCGDVRTQTISATGHNYTSRTVEATCLDYARTQYTCTKCGDFYEEYDSAMSDWSTTKPSGVDESLIESRYEYRYQDKLFASGSNSTMDGWTLYNTTTEWSEYGDWSGWSWNSVAASETTKVETRTVYGYYYYLCSSCGAHMHGYGTCYTWAGGCGATTTNSGWHAIWSPTSWDNANLKEWHGTGKYYTYIDGELVFKWDSGGSKTQYRYCTREQETVYHFYKWSDWSAWSGTAVSANENRNVETRTVYRYVQTELGDHKYVSVITEPTCTTQGYTTHTCSVCSDSYVDSYVSVTAHSYKDTVIAPTCTTAGYTSHACTICGESYKDSYTNAKGHSYKDTVTAPTCTAQGYTSHTCSNCGDSYVDSYVKALGHEYEDGICIRCGEADPDYAAPVADEVIRLSGKGRCETALLIAEELKETLEVEKFGTIIIANGSNFADALAGSYLAAVKDAPILLSWGSNDKHAANIQYIQDNLVSGGTVYILGGTAAVPGLYEEGLADIHVERLSGKSRFDTNIEILKAAGIDANAEILVSTGWNYADSLSASATGLPILLLNTNTGKLEASQIEFLSGLKEKNCSFTIIGGTGAVSAELAADLEAYGNVDRISAKTRYETSVKVAEAYFVSPESAVLAYAWNFPDGLCGGALAYAMNAPLVLTKTGAETAAAGYIQGQGIKFGVVLGGESLISQESIQKIFGTN